MFADDDDRADWLYHSIAEGDSEAPYWLRAMHRDRKRPNETEVDPDGSTEASKIDPSDVSGHGPEGGHGL